MKLNYYVYGSDGIKKDRSDYSDIYIEKFDNLLMKAYDKDKKIGAILVELGKNKYLIEPILDENEEIK